MKVHIRGNDARKEKLVMAAILFFSMALAGLVGPAAADDSISVFCYMGVRSLGNVIVFDIKLAVEACNETYYECKGTCVACYPDPDYVDYVCIDARGNVFLK
jgi:hypothetical protein